MAAFKKQSGRQWLITAIALFDYTQLVSGVFKPLIELPPQAVVEGGSLVITTAFNSATSDVATVGDATSGNRYKSSATIAAAGLGALTPTGLAVTTAALGLPGITWTGVGTAPTTGAGRLVITYYVLGRAQFNQGADA